MSRLPTRLKRLEELARALTPDQEAIKAEIRWLVGIELGEALEVRLFHERTASGGYINPSWRSDREGRGLELDDFHRELLKVHDATPGEPPVFKIGDPEDPWYGTPRIDPGRLEACVELYRERYGFPHRALTADEWLDVMTGGEDPREAERGRGR